MKSLYGIVTLAVGVLLTGCGNHQFNVAGEQDVFQQSNKVISVPIDILWVVDNSGSMATSQQSVADNVASFIAKFKQTNFDYRIAITTTDAYKGLSTHGADLTKSRFRDGTDLTSHSGIYVIDPTTPNLEDVFKVNVLQGIFGGADERGFQSLEAALTNPDNTAVFPRAGSFLAVIFLTDEEDFSWDGTANIQLLPDNSQNTSSDPRLHPYTQTLDFLDTLTSSTPAKRNYVINTIGIFSDTCLQQLSTSFPGRRIASRYAQLTDATGGVKAELCDDFSGILSSITDTILEFSTKFYLSRVPLDGTLQIFVDGVQVQAEGFTYNAVDNSVSFKGAYIPGKDAVIRVAFTPSTLK